MRVRDRVTAAAVLALLAAVAPGMLRAADGPIEDNSFLIEEAYNQGPRIVQHIFTWTRPRGGGAWDASFTQEWPIASQRHQLSYTIPIRKLHDSEGGARGVGDIALNYRFQCLGVGGGSVAFAPRLSVLLPTGDFDRGLGAAAAGGQLNLPFSAALSSRWVTHTNAGLTLVRALRAGIVLDGPPAGSVLVPATRSINLGQSLIWLAAPRVNLMLELAWQRTEAPNVPGDADLEESLYLSPGLRWSHDFSNGLQIVPGVAIPIGIGPSSEERSVFLYLSLEHGY